jgi:hypothetical protein
MLVEENIACYCSRMKTLAEIEAAVESLPQDKKKELLRFIEALLHGGARASSRNGAVANGKRKFPISKGRIPFTSADVARIESESDATL